MPTQLLFPTHIYTASLKSRGWHAMNARLQDECEQLRTDDPSGRQWSKKNYPGGYTSYNSVARLHTLSPTFANLQERIDAHVKKFVHALEWDMSGKEMQMTDCWVNIMPRQVVHSWHLHPLATISGTYYVQTPPGSSALKFEDPRLDRFMAAPPRKRNCRVHNRPWVSLPAQTGNLVLFESWLRHEVPPNASRIARISVSFNYNWF